MPKVEYMHWLSPETHIPPFCRDVLVTMKTKDSKSHVCVAYYNCAEKWRVPGHTANVTVIAWMPLPKPYETK